VTAAKVSPRSNASNATLRRDANYLPSFHRVHEETPPYRVVGYDAGRKGSPEALRSIRGC